MMNKETFYSIVQDPSSLRPEDVDALAAAVRQYPFFHAGWMLLAKGLHSTGSIHFPTELRKASVHVWDRAALFWLIKGKIDRQGRALPEKAAPAKSTQIAETVSDVEQNAAVMTDSNECAPDLSSSVSAQEASALSSASSLSSPVAFEQERVSSAQAPAPPTAPQRVIDFNIVVPRQAESVREQSDDFDFEQPQQQSHYALEDLDVGPCRPDERYTFDDWLDYIGQIQENKQKQTAESARRSKSSLIDAFLDHGDDKIVPTRKPVMSSADARKIEEESTRETDVLTETLAAIYVKQKKFDRAIGIYKSLALKYPEKSSYFASRISEIENRNN